MKTRVTLFVEGTSNTANGDLRKGFYHLLKQKLKGRMPKIVMGEGRDQTIRKFKNDRLSEVAVLLVDLDDAASTQQTYLKRHELTAKAEYVYFMIQEMEAWLLSQANILDDYYLLDINKQFQQKKARDIPKPSEILKKVTKSSKKGSYHKVKHGAVLLEKLDATKLQEDFESFKQLVERFG